MIQDLASLIPALTAAKKSLAAPNIASVEERLSLLEKLSQVWGTATPTELQALADESLLSVDLVRAWDFVGAQEYLAAFVQQSRSFGLTDSRFPRGVISLLQPRWNGLRLLVERLAPALLAGNSVLVKMSSHTPTASRLVEQWCRAAGFSEEQVVVVGGPSSEYAQFLIRHPALSAVSAVGRREVLLQLYSQCGELGRPFQGWCGGRSSMLVLEPQDAAGWTRLLKTAVQDGRGQRPYDNMRVFVLEKDEQQQLDALKKSVADFAMPELRLSTHLTQCSEDHQREALGPVILFSTIKYPFDLAKWVNNSGSGFAVQLYGPVDRLEKLISKLDVGLILLNQEFDPAQSLLFGVRESNMGSISLSPSGEFFSQARVVRH